MKTTWLSLAVSGLLAFAGCGKGTSGGPGAVIEANKPVIGTPENAFSLSTPMLSTTVHQGDTKDVAISISRGKNFDQDVTISFANVPHGVTITPATATLAKSEKEVHVTVAAAEYAGLNDFTIDVIGHPATGPDSKNELKITVAKKS